MSLSHLESGGRIITEHLLTREQLFAEMIAIEDLVHARYGLRGVPGANIIIEEDVVRSIPTIILAYYGDHQGPARHRKKVGNIYITDGYIKASSEQVPHLRGGRIGFDPSLKYDNPSLGKPLENSVEAARAIHSRLAHVLSYRPRGG